MESLLLLITFVIELSKHTSMSFFLYEQISWITCLEEIDMILLFKQILLLRNSAATPFNGPTLKIILEFTSTINTVVDVLGSA